MRHATSSVVVGPCLVGAIAVGVVIAATPVAWAQGPKPAASPAQPTPSTATDAEQARPEPAGMAAAATPSRPAPLPPEVIKAMVAPTLGRKAVKVTVPAAARVHETDALRADSAKATTADEARAEQLQDPNTLALIQSSEQLDKFHKVFMQATKIFGSEHTVISPSFFYATDIKNRLSTVDEHMVGLSGVLLLPLVGGGGGHGYVDWWPVVTTEDATQIYSDFLDQLKQYEEANTNAESVPNDIRTVLSAKWDAQRLAVAVQIFCENDIDWPSTFKKRIAEVCSDASSDRDVAQLVTTLPKSEILPRRHNMLLGPSLGIPLTKSPVDWFQLGGALELGGKHMRFVLTGGLVGRYQGPSYREIFASGWYVGAALSGEIGDKLFHYFNGGSALIAQLAKVKTSQE